MAGGKWTVLDTLDPSQRSGFYINFVSDALTGISAGAVGVVAIPVTAPWGPEATVVTVSSMAELENTFSLKDEGTAYFQIKEALRGGARMVMAYRMAVSAVKASLALQSDLAVNLVTVSARYSGAFGNDLSVSVVSSLEAPGKKEFRLYLGSTLLEKFLFDGTADDLVAVVGSNSAYITLTLVASGQIQAYANAHLLGGNSGLSITATEMTAALNAFEGRANEWNIVALPTSDAAIQDTAVDYIKRLRSEGHFVTLCLGHIANGDFGAAKAKALAINSEAVIYHYIGANVAGVARTPADMTGRIAALIAGAGPDRSITFAEIDGIDSLAEALTNTQVREANRSGLVVAFYDGTAYRIEKGINTLTSFGEGKHEGYAKIKVIAVMDAIGTSLTRSANQNFIGRVLNDEDGQNALLGAVKTAMDLFVQGRLIKPEYTVELDPVSSTGDQVFLSLAVTPVDAMEEIYLSIAVGR